MPEEWTCGEFPPDRWLDRIRILEREMSLDLGRPWALVGYAQARVSARARRRRVEGDLVGAKGGRKERRK